MNRQSIQRLRSINGHNSQAHLGTSFVADDLGVQRKAVRANERLEVSCAPSERDESDVKSAGFGPVLLAFVGPGKRPSFGSQTQHDFSEDCARFQPDSRVEGTTVESTRISTFQFYLTTVRTRAGVGNFP